MKIQNNYSFAIYPNCQKRTNTTQPTFKSRHDAELMSMLTKLAQNTKLSLFEHTKTCGKYTYKKIADNRILVYETSIGPKSSIILPEYLYHITSRDNMNSMLSSDRINITENEQLRGIYLIDKTNFIKNYSKTKRSNGQKADLVSAMFQHTWTQPHNSAPQKMAAIKLPTIELLNQGKFRVRTQEDFFYYKDKLAEYSKKLNKKFTPRGMCEEENRTAFKRLMIMTGEMSEIEAEQFIADMTSALHQGYTLRFAYDRRLSERKSVEYIYNNPIVLSKINYKKRYFDITDYCEPGKKNLVVTPDSAAKILDF